MVDRLRMMWRASRGGNLDVAETVEVGSGLTFLQFFQVDKLTGGPKGIVLMELGQRR